jgi:hypothetical protein
MNRVDAYRMIRRRTADAGFKVKLGCHVFRATSITAYVEAGGTSKMGRPWPRTKARARPSLDLGGRHIRERCSTDCADAAAPYASTGHTRLSHVENPVSGGAARMGWSLARNLLHRTTFYGLAAWCRCLNVSATVALLKNRKPT